MLVDRMRSRALAPSLTAAAHDCVALGGLWDDAARSRDAAQAQALPQRLPHLLQQQHQQHLLLNNAWPSLQPQLPCAWHHLRTLTSSAPAGGPGEEPQQRQGSSPTGQQYGSGASAGKPRRGGPGGALAAGGKSSGGGDGGGSAVATLDGERMSERQILAKLSTYLWPAGERYRGARGERISGR